MGAREILTAAVVLGAMAISYAVMHSQQAAPPAAPETSLSAPTESTRPPESLPESTQPVSAPQGSAEQPSQQFPAATHCPSSRYSY